MKQALAIAITFLCCVQLSRAQNSELYMPREVRQAYEKGTRSPDGQPGKNYWQNASEYSIDVELDPENRKLTGKETITYFNNSPDTLKFLVIKLLQNFHQTGAARDLPVEEEKLNDGIDIEKLTINGRTLNLADRRDAILYGTTLYARFAKDSRVLPDSETRLEIEWNFKVPDLAIRVGAYTDSAYFIGYWFPQIAVYDDVFGWDREQYTGLQETYNDLSAFDVKITVPPGYIVWATGDLQNGKQIFGSEIQGRIERSKSSDDVVHIITDQDYRQKNVFRKNAEVTWHYTADQVPDFAFATSSYYLWDAKSVVVSPDDGRRTWVNTVYPPTAKVFDSAINWAARSIEYFSTELPGIPFPYDKHVSFNGQDHAAIEFPMMANDCDGDKEEFLAEIVAHEIAHTYFPFTVLTNERLCAWMDEGMVKLFGELYTESLGNKRENFEALNTVYVYDHYAGSFEDIPLITASSSLSLKQNFSQNYAKADNANFFLMNLLKDNGIDQPFKQYIETWKGKHPTPWDYFNLMNSVAGEDLAWYWKPWYFEFGYPDLSLEISEREGHSVAKVMNKGGFPVPVILTVTYDNGEVETISKNAGVWKNKDIVEVRLDTKNRKINHVRLGEKDVIDVFPGDNEVEVNGLQSYLPPGRQ